MAGTEYQGVFQGRRDNLAWHLLPLQQMEQGWFLQTGLGIDASGQPYLVGPVEPRTGLLPHASEKWVGEAVDYQDRTSNSLLVRQPWSDTGR